MFPYTAHASTINGFYEGHRDNAKMACELRDEPVAGTPPISDVEFYVRIKAANKTLHEGVHQTPLQIIHTIRNSILKKEIVASQKTLMVADPNDWQVYIYDRVGTTN